MWLSISAKAEYTISKFIELSSLDGVGTDTNIKSDVNVCDKEWTDFDLSLSYIFTSVSQPVCGENPNSTADPTKPLPNIPIFINPFPPYNL